MNTGQADFSQALLEPGLAAPVGLMNPNGVQVTKRFDIYRNNVAVSLTEALEAAFPVISKLLGEGNFKTLAGVYLRRYPPGNPILMFYGLQMPEFLQGFEPVQSLAYLPDVARLELALREAYHAADAEPLEPETLQAMPPERLMASRVVFAPAMRLVRSRWPIHSIWRFNMEDGAAKPEPKGENVLLTRPDFDPVLTTLPPGGDAFISALTRGERFGSAVEQATVQIPEFDLTKVLGQLLVGGAIIRLTEGDQ